MTVGGAAFGSISVPDTSRSGGFRCTRPRQQVPAGVVRLYVADTAADQAVELAAGQSRPLEQGLGDARDQAPVAPYQHAGHGAQPRRSSRSHGGDWRRCSAMSSMS